MEAASLEPERFPLLPNTFLSGAKGAWKSQSAKIYTLKSNLARTEVLSGLRYDVAVKLEDDAACGLAANGDVEVG